MLPKKRRSTCRLRVDLLIKVDTRTTRRLKSALETRFNYFHGRDYTERLLELTLRWRLDKKRFMQREVYMLPINLYCINWLRHFEIIWTRKQVLLCKMAPCGLLGAQHIKIVKLYFVICSSLRGVHILEIYLDPSHYGLLDSWKGTKVWLISVLIYCVSLF